MMSSMDKGQDFSWRAMPTSVLVMIVLMIAIWAKAGGGLLSEVGSVFSGGARSGEFEGLSSFGAFVAVFSIMVGYFAAVVINFGDFADSDFNNFVDFANSDF